MTFEDAITLKKEYIGGRVAETGDGNDIVSTIKDFTLQDGLFRIVTDKRTIFVNQDFGFPRETPYGFQFRIPYLETVRVYRKVDDMPHELGGEGG